MSQRVNWVLDADIRSFFETATHWLLLLRVFGQVRLLVERVDIQAFSATAPEMDGFQPPPLYTLYHRLT